MQTQTNTALVPALHIICRTSYAGTDSLDKALHTRTLLLPIPITRPTRRRETRRFPDPDAVVIACGCEDSRVRGVPCDAVDAADVRLEVFNVLAAGAPDVDSGVCRCRLIYARIKGEMYCVTYLRFR